MLRNFWLIISLLLLFLNTRSSISSEVDSFDYEEKKGATVKQESLPVIYVTNIGNSSSMDFMTLEDLESTLHLRTPHFTLMLSESFEHMKNHLGHLDLSNNEMEGPLPSVLFGLEKLHHLILRNNHFSGPIPQEIENLTRLHALDISHNHFTGPFPQGVLTLCNPSSGGYASALTLLILSHNNFTGPLPEFEENISVKYLYLDHNHFSGKVPKTLFQQEHLEILNLASNKLKGNLPLLNMASLKSLSLSDNEFSGTFKGNLKNAILRRNCVLELTNLPSLEDIQLRAEKPAYPFNAVTLLAEGSTALKEIKVGLYTHPDSRIHIKSGFSSYSEIVDKVQITDGLVIFEEPLFVQETESITGKNECRKKTRGSVKSLLFSSYPVSGLPLKESKGTHVDSQVIYLLDGKFVKDSAHPIHLKASSFIGPQPKICGNFLKPFERALNQEYGRKGYHPVPSWKKGKYHKALDQF